RAVDSTLGVAGGRRCVGRGDRVEQLDPLRPAAPGLPDAATGAWRADRNGSLDGVFRRRARCRVLVRRRPSTHPRRRYRGWRHALRNDAVARSATPPVGPSYVRSTTPIQPLGGYMTSVMACEYVASCGPWIPSTPAIDHPDPEDPCTGSLATRRCSPPPSSCWLVSRPAP